MAPLTARAVSSGVFVQAQASIALVAPQELPACKAFVLEIDYPLLPFPAATPVDRQVLQPLQLPPTCLGELGANYQGEEIANAQLGAHMIAACPIHALRRSAIVEASVVQTARAIWRLTCGIGGKKRAFARCLQSTPLAFAAKPAEQSRCATCGCTARR